MAENIDQAQDRAGGKTGNRGSEAALASMEMVSVIKKLGLELHINSC